VGRPSNETIVVSEKPLLEARLSKKDIPRTYRRIAGLYDAWAALTESKAHERCLEVAAIRDGESVLEVAVGTGLLFEGILRRNPSGVNVGIDLTESMLDRARRRVRLSVAANVSLEIGDAYSLTYADETFDLVISNYLFDMLPQEDFSGVLTEFRRVLRPGGRLLLVNMTKAGRWYQGFWDRLYRLSPEIMGGCRGVLLLPHVSEAGFTRCQRETVSQMGFPSELVFAVKPPR